MTWRTEHGEEYAVPDIIVNAPGLADDSWHNDACPVFGPDEMDWPQDHQLRLWVEHPDRDQRESGAEFRFAVNYWNWGTGPNLLPIAEVEDLYAGDDPEAALRAFDKAKRTLVAKLALDERLDVS